MLGGISPLTFLLMSGVACLVLGLFMEAIPNWYITAPIAFPIALTFGVPITHLYVVNAIAIAIGLLTPPVSVGAFTAASVAEEPIQNVYRYLYPGIVGILVLSMFVYWYFPWFSTWLPNLL